MPFIDLNQLGERELIPGYRVRFIHTPNLTLAYWSVSAGATLPEHAHEHEQIAHVLDGEFELTIAGETQRLKPGQIAVIPPDVPHSGCAVTDCRLLDVFHPVREDYL